MFQLFLEDNSSVLFIEEKLLFFSRILLRSIFLSIVIYFYWRSIVHILELFFVFQARIIWYHVLAYLPSTFIIAEYHYFLLEESDLTSQFPLYKIFKATFLPLKDLKN